MQARSSRCLFFRSDARGVQALYSISLGREFIQVPVPVLWSWPCASSIHQVDESLSSPFETAVSDPYNLSGRHSSDCSVHFRVDSIKGHIDLSPTKPGLDYKLEKVCLESNSDHRVLGMVVD